MKQIKLTITVLVILLAASLVGASAHASGASRNSLSRPSLAALIDWEQANSDGFGDSLEREVSALEAFNGYLYAGTHNIVDPLPVFDGARIYRSLDGVGWTPVTQPGFQNPHDSAAPAILDLVVFNNRIYASTGRGGNPGQVWRSTTGADGTWSPMSIYGFGDPDLHDVGALAVYNNYIYGGASSQVSGAQIYRSVSGDNSSWNLVAPAGPTMAGAGITEFAAFNGALWAIVESEAPLQIWRSTNGSAWTVVVGDGFGDSNTTLTGGMAVFGGYLYVGAGNTASGAQLWRTDGTNWEPVTTPISADSNNQKIESVSVFETYLYVSTNNAVTGIEVWRTADGAVWEQVNLDGFSDSHNTGSNHGHALAGFLGELYLGTSNIVTGGEIWRTMLLANTPTPTTTNTYTPTPTKTATPPGWIEPTATYTSTPTKVPVVSGNTIVFLPLTIRD